MMERVDPKFKVGDFVVNTLHNYTGWLVLLGKETAEKAACLLLTAPKYEGQELRQDWVQEGILRIEVLTELRKIPPTLELIAKTKEHINEMNLDSRPLIDNLSYIEFLSKLNEQEKELKNESQL